VDLFTCEQTKFKPFPITKWPNIFLKTNREIVSQYIVNHWKISKTKKNFELNFLVPGAISPD